MNEDNKWIKMFSDEGFRANVESGFTALVAIAIIIAAKGFINGFSFDLFLSLDPYASGIATGIASSLVMNNMISRGFYDTLAIHQPIKDKLHDIELKDSQIKDYDYVEEFLTGYNKTEYDRLKKLATDKEVRRLKYDISARRSKGKKVNKLETKLDNVKKYGAKVKRYNPVSLQDLLSFGSDSELKGSEKLNFNPIDVERKKLARTKITWFLASGLVAGLPVVTGKNPLSAFIFILVFILMITVNGFKTYMRTCRVTKTTYLKSLQYKDNVLQLCLDNYKHWRPKEVYKEEPKPIILEIGE